MTGEVKDLGLAAPCGIYCGDCEHLKTRCSGCGTLAGKPFWTFDLRLEVCPLYACCVIEKGLEHCGLCPELPCETFQEFHDPALTPETDAVLAPHRDRFSWDAPIHSIQDILDLPYPPRMVNIKPSRLGGLRSLLDAYDHCDANGIGCYGGGQFELGVGRGQNQYLASLFHADAPNDVAPTGFNLPEAVPGLPSSPLAPTPCALGFAWS